MIATAKLRAGFTLIEIMCVVVVLAIAAAMIVPSVSDNSSLNAAAAARTVMADLIYAQNQAINTQQYVYVTFNVTDQTYSLCSSMSPLAYLTDPIAQTNYTRTFGSGSTPLASCTLLTANLSGNATTLAYDPLGSPCVYSGTLPPASLATTASIAVQCGSTQVTINIEPDSGELSVQ